MSDKTDNQELMEVFYEETQGLIDEMREDLSTLAKEQASPILSRLFRCSHIIKSSAGAVGFDDLREISQILEKVLKVAMDEKSKINADVITLLSESIEACQKLLNQEEIAGHKELLERLNKHSSLLR